MVYSDFMMAGLIWNNRAVLTDVYWRHLSGKFDLLLRMENSPENHYILEIWIS